MNEKAHTSRTEESLPSNLLNAVLAAKDVAYVLNQQVAAGFEFAMPEGFKSERDEAKEVMSLTKELLAEMPGEAREKIAGSVIAALKSARTRSDFDAAYQTYNTALSAALVSAATEHKEHMTAEQEREAQLAKLWHNIDENNKVIGSVFDQLEERGYTIDEALKRRLAEIDREMATLPENSPRRLELARERGEIQGVVTASITEQMDQRERNGQTVPAAERRLVGTANERIEQNKTNFANAERLGREAPESSVGTARAEPHTMAFQVPVPAAQTLLPENAQVAENAPAPAPAAFSLSFETVVAGEPLTPNAPGGRSGGASLNV